MTSDFPDASAGWTVPFPQVPEPSSSRRAGRLLAEVVEARNGERVPVERFIAARFARAYGAQVTHFGRHLIGVRDRKGHWHAAAGYTPARCGSLFLEQYLDRPVEDALGVRYGERIARDRVAEVGNLAAGTTGVARALICAIVDHLRRHEYEWVVFTATREVRNICRRLQLAPLELAAADPARLRDGGVAWGSYYAHEPMVMGGRLVAALRCGPAR